MGRRRARPMVDRFLADGSGREWAVIFQSRRDGRELQHSPLTRGFLLPECVGDLGNLCLAVVRKRRRTSGAHR